MKIFNEALRDFSDIAGNGDYNEIIQFNTFQYNNANNGKNAYVYEPSCYFSHYLITVMPMDSRVTLCDIYISR